MLGATEDERTRYCYDLCILTITLTEHYMMCLHAVERIFDTFSTNLTISTAHIAMAESACKIKFGSVYKVREELEAGSLATPWDMIKHHLSSLGLKELILFINNELYRSILVSRSFVVHKRNYFLKFGSSVDKNLSSFNELRYLCLHLISNFGSGNIMHTINKVKLLMDISVEYADPQDPLDPKNVKTIRLADYMPNILSHLYNILIIINQVDQFLTSLPSFEKPPKASDKPFTKLDIIKNLKKYLSLLNEVSSKAECLSTYCMGKNYLTVAYNYNVVIRTWEEYSGAHSNYSPKPLNLDNLGSKKMKMYPDLLVQEKSKDKKDKDSSFQKILLTGEYPDTIKNTEKKIDNDIVNSKLELVPQFPKFQTFLMATLPMRFSNIWYTRMLLSIMGVKISSPKCNTEYTRTLDSVIENLTKINLDVYTSSEVIIRRFKFTDSDLLFSFTSENDQNDEKNYFAIVGRLFETVKTVQLPYSYSILMVIISLELLLGHLTTFYGAQLRELNSTLHSNVEINEDDITPEMRAFMDKKKSIEEEKNKQRVDAVTQYLSSWSSPVEQQIKSKINNYPDETGGFDLFATSKAAADMKIDRVVANLNLLTDYRGYIIKELSNKKILFKEFVTQLVEAQESWAAGETKKKPSIHKFTRREEKLIKQIFCEKSAQYTQVLNEVLYNLLSFNFDEHVADELDKQESADILEILKNFPSIPLKNKAILPKDQLKDLKCKVIGIKVAQILCLVRNMKTYVDAHPKVIEKKQDSTLDSILKNLAQSFDDLRDFIG